jgi:CMP-N,N'-diacetyllegionaminic acid synthase
VLLLKARIDSNIESDVQKPVHRMLRGQRILALIPARAGSKRLPGKNLLCINGETLLGRAIRTANSCKWIDRIVVSTEDDRIAREAVRRGASVPFLRPKSLAADNSTTMDVILHAINCLEKQNQRYDILILLQVTSPLRTKIHIKEALDALHQRQADAIVSVAPAAPQYFWTSPLSKTLCMDGFLRSGDSKLKDKNLFFTINGAIYVASIHMLKRRRTWYTKRTFAYIMNRSCSLDIDTHEDFLLAKAILVRN